MAKLAARADEGKVEAIDIYIAPNNKPVNGGAVIGGLAGGVARRIGSGRGKRRDRRRRDRRRGRRKRNREKAGADDVAIRVADASRFGRELILEDTRDLDLRVGDHVRVENGHVVRI